MKISAVTQFIPLTWPFDKSIIASAARFLTDARFRLADAGFEVQSVCLATPPFLDVLGDPDPNLLLEYAQRLEDLADKHRIDAVSIGPVVATTPLSLLMPIHALPKLMANTRRIHSGLLFADEFSGINLAAARAYAQTLQTVAQASPNGAGNLRLGALASVPPNIPYPHAAYQHGVGAYFIIATQAADLALTAINNTRSAQEASQRLVKSIEGVSQQLLKIVDHLVDDHQIRFKGLDFSLAPHSAQTRSMGAAVENLGVEMFGGSGTLFAMAFLANAIRQAKIPQTGFSGVLLPVLGDFVLAQRAAEDHLSVNDLLLYSAICNAGLDLVPIPGATPADEIAAILIDMAALSISAGRSLSARLLPIPNRAAGEQVSLEDEGLLDGRVLAVKNLGAQKLFDNNSFLDMEPLPPRRRTQSEIYPAY